MNKTVIGIVVVAVVVVAYLLKNEFGGSNISQPEPVTSAQPVINVQEAEDEQINREIIEQSKSSMLSKEYLVKCAPCHDRDGSGPVGAPIKGMTKDELLTALTDYKNGAQENNLMAGLMKNITDEEIEKLSEEIAGF